MFPFHAVVLCAACALLAAGALLMRFSLLSFHCHVRLQSLGTVLAVAGLLLGIQMTSVHGDNAHTVLGLAFGSVLVLQLVLGGFARPSPQHMYRRLWLLVHRVLGLLMAMLCILCLWTGLGVARFTVTVWHRVALLVVLTVVGSAWFFGEWTKIATAPTGVKTFDVTVDEIYGSKSAGTAPCAKSVAVIN